MHVSVVVSLVCRVLLFPFDDSTEARALGLILLEIAEILCFVCFELKTNQLNLLHKRKQFVTRTILVHWCGGFVLFLECLCFVFCQ